VLQALKLIEREHPRWPRVSHETVYHWIFHSAKYKVAQLWKLLVRRRYGCRKHHLGQERRGKIKNMTMIDKRPFEEDDRSEFGHYEGDLVVGAGGKTAVATLVERKTRVTSVLHVASKKAEDVTRALIAWFGSQPTGAVGSLTWDGGKELAYHESFTKATGVQVYFCDPHSPWQRGTNENTNGVLRRKIPKGTDLSWVDQDVADTLSTWLNERPMAVLSWLTPNEALERELVAIGS
jgi:IS30 family transposase